MCQVTRLTGAGDMVQGSLEEARRLTMYHCVPTRSARCLWLLEVRCVLVNLL